MPPLGRIRIEANCRTRGWTRPPTPWCCNWLGFGTQSFFALFVCLFVCFGQTHGMQKFLGQELNSCQNNDASHGSAHARSLTPAPQGNSPFLTFCLGECAGSGSEPLKLLLGAGDLEHIEAHGLAQGLELTPRDAAADLDSLPGHGALRQGNRCTDTGSQTFFLFWLHLQHTDVMHVSWARDCTYATAVTMTNP